MMQGSCNCKDVTFTIADYAGGATACHCGQRRKQSGHHWASGHAPLEDFMIEGDVRWYEASPIAKRGFCPTCGTFLFWKHHEEEKMSFSLGVIDGPTGLSLSRHIFVADKGDYYTLADGVPQRGD